MRALTNPYTPNAGAEPVALVGRDDQLDSFDLLLARIERGRTELHALPLLTLATLFAAPVLLVISLGFGERIWPND